jgi:hypothetical protein
MSDQVRVLKLTDILDDQQIRDVESLVARIRVGEIKLDVLRFYLKAQEESLLKKEILPEYLFYSLIYSCGLC